MANEQKKYLDQNGVSYLWYKILDALGITVNVIQDALDDALTTGPVADLNYFKDTTAPTTYATKVALRDAITDLEDTDTAIQNNVTTISNKVNTLISTDSNKSVRTISAEEVAKVVANAPDDLNTLKEIADWISEHSDDASAMNSAIIKNAEDIATLNGNSSTSGSVSNKVAAEATARTNADNTLQSNIDSEASTRSSADSTLTTNLNKEIQDRTNDVDAEETRAKAAESTLTNNLATEVTNRTNADSTLQTNINNEATTRANADTALSNRVTTLENTKVVKPSDGTSNYKIKIQSGTSNLPSDTNTLTFCY